MTTASSRSSAADVGRRLKFAIFFEPWKNPQSTRTLAVGVSTRYADPVTSPPAAPSSVIFTSASLFFEPSCASVADDRDGLVGIGDAARNRQVRCAGERRRRGQH